MATFSSVDQPDAEQDEAISFIPFLGLQAANGVSLLGSILAASALPIIVFQVSGSAIAMGITAVVGIIPLIVGMIFAGTLVDQIGHRRASILSDLANALTLATIPLLYITFEFPFGVLLGLIVLVSFFALPGATAREALLPQTAERADLPLEQANAIAEMIQGLVFLIGPVLATFVVMTYGPSSALWMNAAAFMLSSILITLTQPLRDQPVIVRDTYLHDWLEGVRLLRSDYLVGVLIFLSGLLILLPTPLVDFIGPVYTERMQQIDMVFDLPQFLIVQAIGTILGAWLYGAVGVRRSQQALLSDGFVAAGITYATLTSLPTIPVLLICAFLMGLVIGTLNPLITTVLQRRTPAHMRGRVFGLVMGFALIASPIGLLAGNAALNLLGVQVALISVAVCFFVLGIGTLRMALMHGLDEPGTAV